MILLSNEIDFLKSFSILLLVVLEISNFLFQLSSSREQQVIEEVFGSVNINSGILDILFQFSNEGVVFAGSSVEIEF